MQIGNTLKNLRIEAELTQTQLSKNLNIGQSTIVGYEKNEREPTLSNLIQYAKFFNVSLDYLTGLEDDFGTKTAAPMDDSLSAEERKLVDDYRQLSPALKEMLQATIETWSNSTANKHMKKGSI